MDLLSVPVAPPAGPAGAAPAGGSLLSAGDPASPFALLFGAALSLGEFEQQLLAGSQLKAGGSPLARTAAGFAGETPFAAPAPVDAEEDAADEPEPDALGQNAIGLFPPAGGDPLADQRPLPVEGLPGEQAAGKSTWPARTAQDVSGLRPDTAGMKSAQSTSATVPAPVWNLRELAHHLRAALAVSADDARAAKQLAAGDVSAAPRPFQSAFDGAPLDARPAGQAGLASASPLEFPADDGGAPAVEASDQNAPAEAQAGDAAEPPPAAGKPLEQEPLLDLDPAAHGDRMAELDSRATERVQPPTGAAAHEEWSPAPIDEAGQTRMPRLIEQVRQVAGFLAERTDGVIRLGENGWEANLRLYPPDLGRVRVEMSVQPDRTVQAQLIAERPETAQLLDQSLQHLREALTRHGLTVERVTVVVQSAAATGGAESGMNQHASHDGRRQADLTQQRQHNPQRHDGRGRQAFEEALG